MCAHNHPQLITIRRRRNGMPSVYLWNLASATTGLRTISAAAIQDFSHGLRSHSSSPLIRTLGSQDWSSS
jgi:hypothetical protein